MSTESRRPVEALALFLNDENEEALIATSGGAKTLE
jgi:hypothetical protein